MNELNHAETGWEEQFELAYINGAFETNDYSQSLSLTKVKAFFAAELDKTAKAREIKAKKYTLSRVREAIEGSKLRPDNSDVEEKTRQDWNGALKKVLEIIKNLEHE